MPLPALSQQPLTRRACDVLNGSVAGMTAYRSGPVQITCPGCGSPLTGNRCPGCGRVLRVVQGILDLREAPPPSCWNDARTVSEANLVEELDAGHRAATTEMLVDLYVHSHRLPAELAQSSREYTLRAVERERWNTQYMGFCMRRYAGRDLAGGFAMEAGCGSGGSLPHLAARFEHVVGIDVDMASLLIAAKRVEELGLEHKVTLIAAMLEQPVMPAEFFDFIKCTDVIEHVQDPTVAAANLSKSLAHGGAMFVLTPNKYCFWLPEPHVRLWGVQFLPAALADWYVKRRIGIPYGNVARLLSYRSFRRLLLGTGLRVHSIPIEDKHLNPTSRRGQRMKRLLALPPLAWASSIAQPVQPTLEALCIKAPGVPEGLSTT